MEWNGEKSNKIKKKNTRESLRHILANWKQRKYMHGMFTDIS